MESILITQLPKEDTEAEEVIEIPMTAADRRRVRRSLQAPDGRIFLLALPTGTVLRVGQVLLREGSRAYRVAAAEEDLLVVRPRSLREAMLCGHILGNLHRDITAGEDHLATLWDEGLFQRLARAGFEVERTRRPFMGNAPGEHTH